MGGTASCYIDQSLEKSLPAYYIKDAKISAEELHQAKSSWSKIIDDDCSAHVRYKKQEDIEGQSALIWFYDAFYERLFEVHPQCRVMFRGSMKAQGKVLVKIIGITIGLSEDTPAVTRVLLALAKVLN